MTKRIPASLIFSAILSFVSNLAFAEPPPQVLVPKSRFGTPLSKEQVQKKTAELRAKYPFESVSKRLAYEDRLIAASKDKPTPQLSDESLKHLESLEVSGQTTPFRGTGLRTRGLEMLHSEQVERFISQEGFGISRLPQPTPQHLELASTDAVHYPRYLLESTEQQSTEFRDVVATGVGNAIPWQLPGREALLGYHLQGQLNFAGPDGLGLVRDRNHVAGFKPHQFRTVPKLISKWDRDLTKPVPSVGNNPPSPPKPVEEWVLRKLELVSLLKHEKPAVYVSATLPKMDDLANAETRDLSTFEVDSLKTLRSGESLVARANPNHLEMVGALRAGKQCMQCHQVQRGELLGAFSYELHRSPELKTGKGNSASGE